jgi:drug/metabolite transporter (DMT)-like permease
MAGIRGTTSEIRRGMSGSRRSVDDMTVDEHAAPPAAPPEPAAWLPVAAAGVTVVLWSSAFVAVRFVGEEISAGPLALGRLLVGSLVLGIVLLPRPRLRPSGRDWVLLSVCGALWFGVYNVALNAAEQRIDAGTAAMLVNIGPLLIAVLAGFLLREGFPRQLIGGSLVAFAGVVVIGVATSSGEPETVGVLLSVLAAGAYAVGVVAQKSLLARLPALQVTWIACTVGMVCCLPFTADLVRETADARTSTVLWLVYLGVFPTALAFTTWAYALNRTSAGRMANTTYLVPPLTILLGWAALGEAPVALAYAGGALCLLGVWLSRRRRAG